MSIIETVMEALKGQRVFALYEEAHDNSYSMAAVLEWSDFFKEYRVGAMFFGAKDIRSIKIAPCHRAFPEAPVAQIELWGYSFRLWDIEPTEFSIFYDAQGREHGEY